MGTLTNGLFGKGKGKGHTLSLCVTKHYKQHKGKPSLTPSGTALPGPPTVNLHILCSARSLFDLFPPPLMDFKASEEARVPLGNGR